MLVSQSNAGRVTAIRECRITEDIASDRGPKDRLSVSLDAGLGWPLLAFGMDSGAQAGSPRPNLSKGVNDGKNDKR